VRSKAAQESSSRQVGATSSSTIRADKSFRTVCSNCRTGGRQSRVSFRCIARAGCGADTSVHVQAAGAALVLDFLLVLAWYLQAVRVNRSRVSSEISRSSLFVATFWLALLLYSSWREAAVVSVGGQ